MNTAFFDSITNKHKVYKKALIRYKARKRRSKNRLLTATKVSCEDIVDQLKSISKTPRPSHLIQLATTLTTSSAWISHTYLRYLISHVNFTTTKKTGSDCKLSKSILKAVNLNEKIPESIATDAQIFRNIYNELEFTHHHPGHQCLIRCPKIKPTIVLISGVLNEIFSTAAFERGAKHLNRLQGINYITLTVKGTKGSVHNANLIEGQLNKYIKKNPNEKLWLVCFSKGGVDALHYLANNNASSESIIGVSTIASPILGTDHLENKVIKLFNKVHKFSNTKLYKFVDDKTDIMAKNLQKSLSTQYQFPWFSRNSDRLPSDIFYSAVAMESEWYESHLWMILTKILFQSGSTNDGVVDAKYAFFPKYFDAYNLGIIRGHHLVGTRSSDYSQEALLEAHIIFLRYKGVLS